MSGLISRYFYHHLSMWSILVMALSTSSCTTTDINTLIQSADDGAIKLGFEKRELRGGLFRLLTYQRLKKPNSPMTIYIEGDGYAWITRHRVSQNPTPRNPVALALALADKQSTNIVYIARPCQYHLTGTQANCDQKFWTSHRFSSEVIDSVDAVIDLIARDNNSRHINLIGYSGGGAVAVLLAAQRDDIASIRTVAGNLDHQMFTEHHKVTPLIFSLNPLNVAENLSNIPQLHFIGRDDDIVPGKVILSYQQKTNNPDCTKVAIVPNTNHYGGWQAQWPDLLGRDVNCLPAH